MNERFSTLTDAAAFYLSLGALRAFEAQDALLRYVVQPYLDGHGALGCSEAVKLSIWQDALAYARARSN